VDGFLAKNGKMFLIKRNVEPFKGFWGCVGGFVETNETPQEALMREFKEETDLDVEVGEYISTRFEETHDRIKKILTYRIISVEGKVKLNGENQEYGWFSELPAKSICRYDEFLFKP